MFASRQRNALMQYLAMQPHYQQPNMLASADQGFDPNGIVAKMLAAQRAAEAARAAQAQKQPQQPQRPSGWGSGESALQQRMRAAGLE